MYTNATAYPDYFSNTAATGNNAAANGLNELDEEDLQPATQYRRSSHLSSTSQLPPPSTSQPTATITAMQQFPHKDTSTDWLQQEEPPAFFSDSTTKDPYHQSQQREHSSFAPVHYFTTDEEVIGGGGSNVKEMDGYDWFQSSFSREEPAAVDPTFTLQEYPVSGTHQVPVQQHYECDYDYSQQYNGLQQQQQYGEYSKQQFDVSLQYDSYSTLPNDASQPYETTTTTTATIPNQYDVPQQNYETTAGYESSIQHDDISQQNAAETKSPVVEINYESYARKEHPHDVPLEAHEAVVEKVAVAAATDASYFGTSSFSFPQETSQGNANAFALPHPTQDITSFTFVPQEEQHDAQQQQPDTNTTFTFPQEVINYDSHDSYQQQQGECFPIEQTQSESQECYSYQQDVSQSTAEQPTQSPTFNYFEQPPTVAAAEYDDSQQQCDTGDGSYFYPPSTTVDNVVTEEQPAAEQQASYNYQSYQSSYATDTQVSYNDYFSQAATQTSIQPPLPMPSATASAIKVCSKCAFENSSRVNFCGMCGNQLVEKLEVMNMLENLSITSSAGSPMPLASIAVPTPAAAVSTGIALGMTMAKPPPSSYVPTKSPMMMLATSSPSSVVESRIHPAVSFGFGGKTYYTFPKSQVRYNATSQPTTKYTPDSVHVSTTLLPESIPTTPLLGMSKKELVKVLEGFEADEEMKKILGLMLEHGPRFMGEVKARQKLINEVLRTENALNFGASTGAFFSSKFRAALEQGDLKRAFTGAVEDQDWTGAFLVLPMLRREDAMQLHGSLSESLPKGDPLKLFINVSVNLPLTEHYLAELAQDWRQSVALCLSLNPPGLEKALLALVPHCCQVDQLVLQLLAGVEDPTFAATNIPLSELHEAIVHYHNTSYFKGELFPHKLAMAERLALDSNALDLSRKYLQAITTCLKTSTKPVHPHVLQRIKALEERVAAVGDVCGGKGSSGVGGWKLQGLFDVIDKGMQKLVGVEEEAPQPVKTEYGDYRPEPMNEYEPPRSHENDQTQSYPGYEPSSTQSYNYSQYGSTLQYEQQQPSWQQSYEPVTQVPSTYAAGYSEQQAAYTTGHSQPQDRQYSAESEYNTGQEQYYKHQQQYEYIEHYGVAAGGETYHQYESYQEQQQTLSENQPQPYGDDGSQDVYGEQQQQQQYSSYDQQQQYSSYQPYTQPYEEPPQAIAATTANDDDTLLQQQQQQQYSYTQPDDTQPYGRPSQPSSSVIDAKSVEELKAMAAPAVPTIKLSPVMPGKSMAPSIPMPKVMTDFHPTTLAPPHPSNNATITDNYDDLGFGNKPPKAEAPSSPVSSTKKSDAATSGAGSSVFSFIKKILPIAGGGGETSSPTLSNKSSTHANLGQESSFYYDEKLKRWVNKGEEGNVGASIPPPPPKVGVPMMGAEGSPASGSLGDVSNMTPPSSHKPTNLRSKYVDPFATAAKNSGNYGVNGEKSMHPPQPPAVVQYDQPTAF